MSARFFLMAGGLFALLANVLGAFGSHALREKLSASSMQVYQTAVQYQFYHGLALLFLGLFMLHFQNAFLKASGVAFILGVLFFSGSLYLLTITGYHRLGYITPFGGFSFLLGWVFLLVAVAKL